MDYEVADIFYSLQGEGYWGGCAASFIRLAGCNVNCSFCDTNYTTKGTMNENAILDTITNWKKLSNLIIITGGEPLLQDLQPLVKLLRTNGYNIHLETNGTIPIGNLHFDWITVSPKGDFQESTILSADEIKLLYNDVDFNVKYRFIEQLLKNRLFSKNKKVNLWIMPLDDGLPHHQKQIADIVKFCLDNPIWRLCFQSHKVGGFK